MKPAALLALLLLSACQKAEVIEQAKAADQRSKENFGTPDLYKDRVTGCEYIWAGSLVARIDSDGRTHRGCKTPLLEK